LLKLKSRDEPAVYGFKLASLENIIHTVKWDKNETRIFYYLDIRSKVDIKTSFRRKGVWLYNLVRWVCFGI